jgi:CSLREA domain-containing protein
MKLNPIAGKLITVLSLVLALLIPVGKVSAATYTVTRFDDPTPGTCDPGDCSLREAISAANADGYNPDIIELAQGTYILSIFGTGENDNATGDLDILWPTTISGLGNGALITGADLWDDRIIDNRATTSPAVNLNHLSITGGDVSLTDSGGGIKSIGPLEIQNCDIYNNKALSAGGVFAMWSLLMENSSVHDNISSYGGGGLWLYQAIVISNSQITGNHTSSVGGGGIQYGGGGTLQITNTTIKGNSSLQHGGGIQIDDGTLILTGSTISGNSTPLNGGGINSTGNMNILNSTISGNLSEYGLAGGLALSGTKTVTMNNSTVVFNTNYNNSLGTGGVYIDPAVTFSIQNTIIARNSNWDTNSRDCYGTIIADDYNLVQDLTSCSLTTGTHNLTGIDPKLNDLRNNGGLTYTHAPKPGSPVLEAGNPITDNCLAVDQTGKSRPVGVLCDIGAYEGMRALLFVPLIAR